MEIKSKYEPSQIEDKWYEYWDKHKLFSSKPDNREPYTIVIPPPNVTGVLHMGHVLNETIQDILVRRARMNGKNALWVPGTDHASIATEAKVVAKLAEQGIKKSDLTREEFLKHAWAWTEEHGGIILKQLRKLGASCDWDRTAFTMDEVRSKSVIHVFVDLYRKGLIYRGVRMVNWDPKAQTALSDEEVVYHDEHSKLYYLRYYVVDPQPGEKMYAVVATTRPETIMGDTAMCINPNDPKNSWGYMDSWPGYDSNFNTVSKQNYWFRKLNKFTEQGYGVIIGEYGVSTKKDGSKKQGMEAWMTSVLENCEKYNYCPMLWDCNTFFKKNGSILGFTDSDIAAVYLSK